jgi:endogenous inhibitor of DNA gyrase (YacG/DUF329 family)
MSALHLCPTCRSAVARSGELRPKSFPFCSDRCQLVDLSKWLDGDYVVPQPISPDDHEAIEQVIAAKMAEG